MLHFHESTSTNHRMIQPMKSSSRPAAPRALLSLSTIFPLPAFSQGLFSLSLSSLSLFSLGLFSLGLVSAAPSGAAETLQSNPRASAFYAWEEAGRACVSDRSGEVESCWTLAPGGRLTDLAEVGTGWLVAGYEHGGEDTDVFVLAGGDREPERLPKLPAREALRGSPRLVADDARLLGIVWLEGDSQPVLELRAAEWLGSAWGPVVTVAPRGVGSQVAPDVAVLDDGGWLAVWTAFDGTDDETVWSLYDGASWSPSSPLHEDNEVPDVLPVVLPTRDGAVAAWSSFDGRDYRLRTAYFDGASWRLEPPLPGRGAGRAELFAATGGILLRYHSVVPAEWVAVELDPRGRVSRRAAVESSRLEAPLIEALGWGVRFAWPLSGRGSDCRLERGRQGGGAMSFLRRHSLLGLLAAAAVTLCAPATSNAQIFRYMAFGDSITKANLTFDPTGIGGYPGRLPPLIDCVLPDCEVINKGKDAEATYEGVTRIETLLDTANWDVVLLMEGTNDVFVGMSNNSIEANLGIMDDKARDRGVDTLHASIIHLDPESSAGQNQNKVNQVADLRLRIMDLADERNRFFADPWSPLCPNQSCFDQHYHDPPGAVGHPDPSGFDILANVFKSGIKQRPVPGYVTAVFPTGVVDEPDPTYTWNKENSDAATWYEFQLLEGSTILQEGWFEENAICAGTQCTLDFTPLPDGNYTWQVRGRNPRGRSNWRITAFEVLTLLPPTTVTLDSPLGFTGEAEPPFQWTREEPRVAASYQLEISDEGGVIHDVTYPVFSSCVGDSCTVDPFSGNPLTPGEYSWRVQGSNAAGAGPWSEIAVFELIPGLVFADGFESGDTSAWSMTFP